MKFLIQIWVKCVPRGLIDNKAVLVQAIAWHWRGDKPLFEPRLTHLSPGSVEGAIYIYIFFFFFFFFGGGGGGGGVNTYLQEALRVQNTFWSCNYHSIIWYNVSHEVQIRFRRLKHYFDFRLTMAAIKYWDIELMFYAVHYIHEFSIYTYL